MPADLLSIRKAGDASGTTYSAPAGTAIPDGYEAVERTKTPASRKAEAPRKRAEIPGLADVVRDVNAREGFGWPTELLTAIVPTTYPELAAMLGLSILGGPLAGAAGPPVTRAAGALAGKGAEAFARVAATAFPAAVTGLATEGSAAPGGAAAIGQTAVEAGVPAFRALPFVSQWLQRRASSLDVAKIAEEMRRLVPAWKDLLPKKATAQDLVDTILDPKGQQALSHAYETATETFWSGAKRLIDSPALASYSALKAADPAVSARVRDAAEAVRWSTRGAAGAAPPIKPKSARILMEELEKDVGYARNRLNTDPRAGDMIELGKRARSELRSALGSGYDDAHATYAAGKGLTEFMKESKALEGGIFGPRYVAPRAQQGLMGKPGEALAERGIFADVADTVMRGKPLGHPERETVKIDLGKWSLPTGIAGRSPFAPPGVPEAIGVAAAAPAQKLLDE